MGMRVGMRLCVCARACVCVCLRVCVCVHVCVREAKKVRERERKRVYGSAVVAGVCIIISEFYIFIVISRKTKIYMMKCGTSKIKRFALLRPNGCCMCVCACACACVYACAQVCVYVSVCMCVCECVSVHGCAKIKGFALSNQLVLHVCVCERERESASAVYFKNQALILAKNNWV